jgi:hypothetical protein
VKISLFALGRALQPSFRRISPTFASIVTRSISLLLPASLWYSAAFRTTRILTTLTRPVIGWTPQRTSWLLYGWLKQFLRYERRFPIPIRSIGGEIIQEARTNPKGMVMVSVHLPLAIFISRTLLELDCPPDAIVASGELLKNGMFPIWGTVNEVPGLAADRNVLIKTRSILRRGGSIAAMIDTQVGGSIEVNLLRLLGSVGARLVLALAELQSSGEILVQFYNPPDPFCSSDEGIMKNVEFFEQKIDEILLRSFQPNYDLLLRDKEDVSTTTKQKSLSGFRN